MIDQDEAAKSAGEGKEHTESKRGWASEEGGKWVRVRVRWGVGL